MKLPDHLFLSEGPGPGDAHAFDAEEARHAAKALRLRVGDRLRWTDGRGGRFAGRLTDLARDGMTATAEHHRTDAPPVPLVLAVGVLHDATRLEWLCEKATELGATEIRLVETARVQRSRYRMARLEAKVRGALKQSDRSYLPAIVPLPLKTCIDAAPAGLRVVAHCYRDLERVDLRTYLQEHQATAGAAGIGPATMLIGPEGDFTREEVARVTAAGFAAVSLGEARLRTETAALKALSLIAP